MMRAGVIVIPRLARRPLVLGERFFSGRQNRVYSIFKLLEIFAEVSFTVSASLEKLSEGI